MTLLACDINSFPAAGAHYNPGPSKLRMSLCFMERDEQQVVR